MVTAPDSPPRHYLRAWRERRGWLQSDLAKRVGCPASVISRYETGDRRIHLDMLFRLMAELGVTPAEFFSHPDNAPVVIDAPGATPEQRRLIGNLAQQVLRPDDAK